MQRRLGWARWLVLVVVAGTVPLVDGAPAAADRYTERVSVDLAGGDADSDAYAPDVSGDGRFVVFASASSDLVPGDTGESDVFLRDRLLGTTTRVSVDTAGGQANGDSDRPAISGDGRHVLFQSSATDLVADPAPEAALYLRDLEAGTTEAVSVLPDGTTVFGNDARLSGDGRVVAFTTQEESGDELLWRRDLRTGTTELVVRSTWFDLAVGGIDGTGSLVGFAVSERLHVWDTNDERDSYVFDTATHTSFPVSVVRDAEGVRAVGGDAPALSGDGTVAVLTSAGVIADPPGDDGAAYDMFAVGIRSGTAVQVTVDAQGRDTAWTGHSASLPSVSDDGTVVALATQDPISPVDECCGVDVYVRDLRRYPMLFASSDPDGGSYASGGYEPALSGDGRVVVFESSEPLVPDDGNGRSDVFATPTRPRGRSFPTLSVGGAAVDEGDERRATVAVPITMSRAAEEDVVVRWSTQAGSAVAPEDFRSTSGTVTIPAGEPQGELSVPVLGDTTAEPDEFLTVRIDGVAGAVVGVGQGRVDLLDDDGGPPVAAFSAPDVTVPEAALGGGRVALPVRLSRPSPTPVSVPWEVRQAAVHASPRSGTVTFPAGATSATVGIFLAPSDLDHDEALPIAFAPPSGLAVSDGLATVHVVAATTGEDRLTIAAGDVAADEGDVGTGLVAVPVVLSRPARRDVTVTWTTVAGTATAPADYVAADGSLVIPAGTRTGTVEVTVNGDEEVDGGRFTVRLTGASAGSVTDADGIVDLVDDDGDRLTVALGDVTVVEGDDDFVRARLTITASRPVDSALEARVESIFGPGPRSFRFEPGDRTAYMAVDIDPDELAEDTVSIPVRVVGPDFVVTDTESIVTIVDDDGP
ncbi:MAG TPA: Calx-beta domain-containing protein [Acidimicrobiales bacterium]|jgi:hypothetical protein